MIYIAVGWSIIQRPHAVAYVEKKMLKKWVPRRTNNFPSKVCTFLTIFFFNTSPCADTSVYTKTYIIYVSGLWYTRQMSCWSFQKNIKVDFKSGLANKEAIIIFEIVFIYHYIVFKISKFWFKNTTCMKCFKRSRDLKWTIMNCSPFYFHFLYAYIHTHTHASINNIKKAFVLKIKQNLQYIDNKSII